jgi:metal-sulfur cluster biosynthetic enzyme
MSGVEPSASADATESAPEADPVDPAADTDDGPVPGGVVPDDATGLEADVWNAVSDVQDLHVPISLVDMGMIYGVEADDATGEVTVEMTFPCMGCPGYEMLQGDVSARVGSVPGVEDVTVEVVWDPIWTTDRLTEEAHEQLTDCGIGL